MKSSKINISFFDLIKGSGVSKIIPGFPYSDFIHLEFRSFWFSLNKILSIVNWNPKAIEENKKTIRNNPTTDKIEFLILLFFCFFSSSFW